MMASEAHQTMPSRARRAAPSPSQGTGGFVFAIAALPGEAEGFRWPSWLSPIAGNWTPRSFPSSSKRSR
jgi:hypothetical protein